MIGDRQIKSNDLGALFEKSMKEALSRRQCIFWRLHTIRSYAGVTNPCDFIVLAKEFTALLECKATTDDYFSCAAFRQLKHFERSAQFAHIGRYGVVVYFHSSSPMFVYASDKTVIANKEAHRRIRVSNPESFDLVSSSLDDLLEAISNIK